jgi:hypothetical protein
VTVASGEGLALGRPQVPIIVPEGGSEVEPNGHPRAANIMSAGHVYWGEAEMEQRDYFRLALPEGTRQLRFVWRVLESTGQTPLARTYPSYRCRLDVLNENEVNIGSFEAPDRTGEARSELLDVRSVKELYFKVEGTQGDCRYELEASMPVEN